MALSSPSFGSLIDQTLTYLHGLTTDLEQVCALSADITNSATSFQVSDATQVTRGLVEIDSELMWVTSVDVSSNTVTIAPGFGRGFRETDPASHTQNSMVTNNPRFPRKAVATAIQTTLYAAYPDLFDVKVDETQTTSPVVVSYQVPADCDQILDVQWQAVGPSKMWVPIRRWELDTNADTTAFPTGKSIDIYDGTLPGRTIKITYAAQPTQLSAETDLLSVTGLPDSVQDVLVYGACYRLTVNLEASRLQTATVEQSERSTLVMPGAAMNASKYYFGLYSQALQREAARLQKLYPTRAHLVR